jgi:hypothetical protein
MASGGALGYVIGMDWRGKSLRLLVLSQRHGRSRWYEDGARKSLE